MCESSFPVFLPGISFLAKYIAKIKLNKINKCNIQQSIQNLAGRYCRTKKIHLKSNNSLGNILDFYSFWH